MQHRLSRWVVVASVCGAMWAPPAFADCMDVLSSIRANLDAFATQRAALLDLLGEIGANEVGAEREAKAELAFSLRETVVGLAAKITAHAALVSEVCIPDE